MFVNRVDFTVITVLTLSDQIPYRVVSMFIHCVSVFHPTLFVVRCKGP